MQILEKRRTICAWYAVAAAVERFDAN